MSRLDQASTIWNLITMGDCSLEVLWEDGERIFCRRRGDADDGNSTAALAVLPASDHPTRSCLDRLAHEYGLKEELDAQWAVRPLEFVRKGGRAILVLEDPGGEPLDCALGAPMEVGRFLHFAIGIATALGKVHQRGLVHKDIKPANILVNGTTGEVRLTGFGIASRLSRERQAAAPPEALTGTLSYMAPEQTGRMNRSVDSRSDLYAVGVTFYQMLTGALPFTATDPMGWVHCHLARQPIAPDQRRKEIPDVVSAIIMKLLAKMAEDRYQTAAGLVSDLRRCLSEWNTNRRIGDFALGDDDTPDRLLIPEKLYGRGREVDTLLAAFERVANGGAPELILVSGYSGIGKSSVVNELHKALARPCGLFASGKFDQYKRDVPYAILAQAFQSLVRSLLSKSEEELSKWRDALRDALGQNGKLIIDLVPELQLIIGQPPPLPDLPLQDAQRRFQLVFRRFIGVFARVEHPLSLFLDDLQWLDSPTLDLIENLLTHSDVRHLMLIGAYRDNEVNSSHPLMHKLDAIRRAGALLQEIALAPLTREDLGQLISDALHCESERATALAELIHDKTVGNPFFAIQFISELVEEGLLTFDYGAGRWSWNMNSIRAKGYTDNIADLMVGKLNRLPVETQQALQLLASLGNSAEFVTLEMASQQSTEEMHGRLWEAIRVGLISSSEHAYTFLHDRVQEAAYALIPEKMRAETHLRLGNLLAARISPEQRERMIFEIVNHLNRGSHLITSPEERKRLAELNLIAGRRAKSSTAYTSALSYLSAARGMLTEENWTEEYELLFSIEYDTAECELVTAEMVAAKNRLLVLAQRAKRAHDIAAVSRLRVTLYTALDHSDRAVEICLEYLRSRGTAWSPHPARDEVVREYDRIWSQLGSRQIEALIDLPLMTNLEVLDTLDVLTEVHMPAAFTDYNLPSLVICRMVNLSLEHGNSAGSCLAYLGLAMIAGALFGNYEAGSRFGELGYRLVEKYGFKRVQSRTYMILGNIVMPWTRHVRAGRDLIRRAFDVANEFGDVSYVAYSRIHLISNLLAAGDHLADAQREAEDGLAFAQKARFGLVIDIHTTQLALIRTLRGSAPKFGCLDDERMDERGIEHHFSSNPMLAVAECWYWIRKMQARYLTGNYSAVLDASSKAQPLLWTCPSHFEWVDWCFYGSLSHAASWDVAPRDEKQPHFEALIASRKRLDIWARYCPENFGNRAALVAAEIARIEGHDLDAMRLYEQAIRSAHANGFVHNEAIAYEVAARFYAARGFDKIANTYLVEARYGYLRWGADGKARQLDEKYSELRQEMAVTTSMIAAPVELLDLATVIKVSEAAGETVLEKLIDRLMRAAIEHAGAERGLLIVPRGDDLQIEAEATTRGAEITVHLAGGARIPAALLESIVRYAVRTRESVILDDALSQNPFSADPYVVQRGARSILCLPLINRGKLIGILYLENNLTPRVFTPDRITMLKVLASQAAISLENSRLYRHLEDREGKIRRLIDSNIIGIFMWDFEGQILEANEAFLRMVGYDHADLVAGRLRWTDLTPSDWKDLDTRLVQEHKMTGILRPVEKEYFRKDGSRVPVLIGAATFEEGGNKGVAFVLDLTERKRAEERLRVQHTVAQILAEAVTIKEAIPRILRAVGECLGWDVGALWRVDLKAKALRCVEFWHKASIEVSEFEIVSRESTFAAGLGLPGRVWSSLQAEYVRDVVSDENFPRGPIAKREELHAALAFPILLGGEALGVIEFFSREIRQPDQELLNVLATIGSQIGQFIERKRAEEALREGAEALRRSDAWLAQAQRLSHTGTWVLDGTTRCFLYWSDESYRIWGFDPLQGLPSRDDMWRRIHPDDRERLWKEVQEALREQRDFFEEFRILLPDGTVKYLEANTHHEFTPLGALLEVICTNVDVTERKRAQDEHERLRHLESDFAHMNRVSMMGELAASLSHEITQPIASARNNARAALNFLDRHPSDLSEVREALGGVLGDTDRARDIIGRIRDHMKKAPPRRDHFDLNAAINEVIALAQSAIIRNGVSVETRLADESFAVQGDRIQLQQVILNLILNAVEAMSSVEVGARELLISTEQSRTNGVLVAVRDSGPGIDPKHVERVFEAFYTTKSSGTGMGLSICRSIINSHGGRLWADVSEPRGAVFQFTLPSGERNS
jgi:PAS domain S-box-containing protein